MSRHHIMPPAIYTPPPPKKIETKKRRIGIGMLNELDEPAETREFERERPTGAGRKQAPATELS